MANQKHVKILKEGVEVWNKWREDNPMIKPNLSNAKLTRSRLPKINLSNANLRNVSLDESILFKADFTEAVLVDANLVDSDLSRAKLSARLYCGPICQDRRKGRFKSYSPPFSSALSLDLYFSD